MKQKVFLTALVIALSGFQLLAITATAALRPSSVPHVALIYDGGTSRKMTWNAAGFAPYVSVKQTGKGEQWLFDSFLFLDFTTTGSTTFSAASPEGRSFMQSLSVLSASAPFPSANQKDWQDLLNVWFANAASGLGVRALDNQIQTTVTRIGTAPFGKHHVIFSLPNPMAPQTDRTGKEVIKPYTWTTPGGSPLVDPATSAGRIAAVEWFIDKTASLWKTAQPKNLDLAGFYWLEENAWQDFDILPKIASYIHGKGMKFYWIPSWRGYKSICVPDDNNKHTCGKTTHTWRDLGFDFVYIQPNYYQNRPYKTVNDANTDSYFDSRIKSALSLAKQDGLGLELELDARVSTDAARPAHDASNFVPRLKDALATFNHALRKSSPGFAYYEGGGELYYLSTSTSAADQALYQEIAEWMLSQ